MPRMGMGMPLVATAQSSAVNVEDVLWENYSDSGGEIAINYQQTRTNLVRHSNFATDAIWSKTNATISTSNKEATVSVTNGAFSFLSIPVSYTSGQTYTLSAEINGTVDKRMRFQDIANDSGGLGTSNAKITMTGQPQQISVTFVANANSSQIVIARQDTSGNYSFTIKNVQVEEGPEATAFIITGANAAAAVTTTLNDTHDIWDFDNADLMPEEDPDSEGVWERPSNIVLNHDYADLGAEEITNGDFATDLSGWTLAGTNATNTITWETNGARIISTNVNIALSQNTLIVGKTYRLTCDVAITFGKIGLDGISIANGNTVNLVEGFNEITFVADSTTLKIKRVVANSNCLLDNVSVKQIDPNDRWALGTGWTISSGKLIGDGTNTDFQGVQQNNVTVVGDTYEATVTVEATSGQVELKGSAVYKRIDTLGVGTHTFTFIADSTNIRFLAHASATITLDNFTVKEYAITPLDV